MHEQRSLADSLASLSEDERTQAIQALTGDQARALLHDWAFWARPNQRAPQGDWYIWLILAGRGFGKTRAGAEWVCERARDGRFSPIALVGETAADVRDVMVEAGESSILKVSPPWFLPRYEPSKRRLTWPRPAVDVSNCMAGAFAGTGCAVAHTYTGDEPDQLRGPQHGSAWCDEPAKWRYADEAWANLELGLRAGVKPQCVATTTPKPTRLIRALVKDPDVRVTTGSTYENIGHLSPAFIRRVVARYEGTRLGAQELHAQILEDTPGALWTMAVLEEHRTREHPPLVQIGIGVDPAASSGEESDETGIVVAGRAANGHAYVLDDLTLQGTPLEWARAVFAAFQRHSADLIVAEANNGGEMVEHTLRTLRDGKDRPVGMSLPLQLVWASRGKRTRAEPIAALYEQGRVHHVGVFGALESQMTTWVPDVDRSPDRMDALVWILTKLLIPDEAKQERKGTLGIVPVRGRPAAR